MPPRKTEPAAPRIADPSEGVAYVDGCFVPVGEARVPILDWGFLRSDATYDVVHVWKDRFFRLEDHLDRFQRGMARLRMDPGLDRKTIRAVLMECVRRSGLRDAYVEMICTRGVPRAGSRDPRLAENRFSAFAIPFVWIADLEKQATGLSLVISRTERIPPEAVDPTVKNYHWLDLTAGLLGAYDEGGDTAVLTDRGGNVVEGPGFNIFVVRGGGLVTPEAGVLEGITRRTVLEIAAELDFAVERRALPADEVRAADEVFLTSTAGGIMPVTRVDGAVLRDNRPGAVTERLRARYWAMHEEPRFSVAVR